ncbi:MAG: double-cubane-cluster-containing anaerobic reductase [Pyramidobacter sp.]|nr:double-cubane-cluster-containing anaerobic reductase [Pyramidobacter sp.]
MRSISQIVEDMRDHLRDGPVLLKEKSEQGVPIIGTYCTYVPWEIIHAAGGVSVSLCAKNEKAIPAAEERLPRTLCPLIKASYGHALKGTCPYFHFCGLIVAESTCDGKKKMFELMNEITPVYSIQIPQSADRPEDKAVMKREFELFRAKMEQHTGNAVTDEALRASIALRNRERAALKKLWELSALDNPPLTGYEVEEFGEYMQYHFDKEEAVAWLEQQVEDIKAAMAAGEDRGLGKRPRVMVTGCPIGGAMKVVKAIEDAGGLVVCFENCGGQKELNWLVDENADPLDALTDKYLSIGCSVMSPNPNRMNAIKGLCALYRVDGVVDMTLTSCHTYAIETYTVRELVRGLGKSYLNVETDYSESDKEQLATRIGAFLEML